MKATSICTSPHMMARGRPPWLRSTAGAPSPPAETSWPMGPLTDPQMRAMTPDVI